MAKKQQNMAITHILRAEAEKLPENIRNLYSGGIFADFDFMPEDILVWKSSRILPVTRTNVHQRMILKVLLSGKCTMLIDGLRIPLRAGDMLLLFPYQFHTTRLECPREEYSFLAVTFTEKSRNYSSFLPLKNCVLHPDAEDQRNLTCIIRNSLHPAVPEATVFALLNILLNQRRKFPVFLPERPEKQDLFDRICDCIRTRFHERISLKTLAFEFGVSTETIRREFIRAGAGITPGRLILQLRIQQAVKLLESTKESAGTIALQCGFSDAFTFSRCFRNVTGHSPAQHRKQFP